MLRMILASALVVCSSTIASADSKTAGSPSSGQAKSETTYKPVYNFDKNTSVGGYSNTTTTGGYSTNGSGHAIPNGTRGSTQDSSKGIMFERRF